MDNRTSNNDDTKWVEESIARLSPPSGWKPEADQAFERMMQQRRTPASSSPLLRLSLAGAMIAAIALIVTLLPWQTLWAPKPEEKNVSTEKLAEHIEPAAQPIEALTITEPQQAPSTPEAGGTPSREPTGPAPEKQTTPEGPQPRPKKNPRPFASLQEQTSGPEPSVAALQGAQGQTPQSPDTGARPPVLISRVAVEYTPEAREAKVTGTVEVAVTLREDGTVKFERVIKSVGYGLDEACAAAVERFKFRPATKHGQPVAVSISLLCNFSLR